MSFKKFSKLILDSNSDIPSSIVRVINQLQSNIENVIQPLSSKTQNDSIIISNISLTSGTNVISHKLGKPLSGWKIVRNRAAATFYDIQDSNKSPELTLLLVSSSVAIVDLEVF